MKYLVFWGTARALLLAGWLVLPVFSRSWTTYPGIVVCRSYGHISGGVFSNSSELGEDLGIFTLGIKGASAAAWYWRVPTNFIYDRFELQTGRESGEAWKSDHLSVRLPSLTYRANSSTGILDAVILRRFLVDSSASADFRPTASDCEWIMGILKLAHEGSFPRPRHHGIKANDFAILGTPPPSDFDISFQHFDLGMGFPWPFWTWLIMWCALVWIARRKRLRPKRKSAE